MDKRSWPWKKKSSDKQAAEKGASASDPSAAASDDGNNKKSKYVQISTESYTHLTGLEDRVKSYEEQVQTLEDSVKELNAKLSEAHSEMTNKENMVKQHAKVAEEAVSGWEKAEEEAAMLKNQMESTTLLKLTAEDRATHLDGALKECMRQIRTLKEEHDTELNEVVMNKTKLFDKMKLQLEAKMANLEQELLRSAAENAALSRSLQERSNMLIKLSEEKSQAAAEIEQLKSNIESYEKEVNSLKYEVHVARKEVEIRNEEKNMSVRSADVANKQHLEGVKKIAKLEAECQRLRGLVRKKLPGPAALAQMKLEVEHLGRDYGESRLRRSPVKPQMPENELLTERLLSMDEETRMLKEALAKRTSELQTSRSICAQTANKLQSLEAQLQVNGEQRSSRRTDAQVSNEGFSSKKGSNGQSFTNMAEDGNDDNVSCADSWATMSMSELSYVQREKNSDSPHISEKTRRLDLMDDFLEMEKLAYQSHESNGTVPSSDMSGNTCNTGSELVRHEASVEVTTSTDLKSGDQHGLEPIVPLKDNATMSNPLLQAELPIFVKLRSKISMILESICKEKDMEKVIAEVRQVMQDMLDTLHHQPVNGLDAVKGISLSGDVKTINQELEVAISSICDFIKILGKEATGVTSTSADGDGVNKILNKFSAKYSVATDNKINLVDLVIDISQVLSKASTLHFNIMGFRSSEVETGSSDCIDKIVLPENKPLVDSSEERYPNGCSRFSDSASDPDVPSDGNPVPTSESTAKSWKCSSEEFEELKMDKDNMAVDLARCTADLESTKSQLLETEELLADVKSRLTSAQESNSLAETQLKCVVESYRSLETRAEELQTEVNLLQGKIDTLDKELQAEKRSHQYALTRCNELLEQLQRIDGSDAAGNNDKTNQETELAAAAEKLAECQETIFILGKQLKALHPQTERLITSSIEEEAPTVSGTNIDSNSLDLHRACSESPLDLLNQFCPSDSEPNNPPESTVQSKRSKHRHTKSGSSSIPTPEKQTRGFSRFFSSKGKNA